MCNSENGGNEVGGQSSVETWADVVGYEGQYQVSDYGKVRSLDRAISAVNQAGPYTFQAEGQEISPRLHGKYRHLMVRLFKRGKRRERALHRLVAEAFVPGRQSGWIVIHLDGDKRNCRADNLEWRSNRMHVTH